MATRSTTTRTAALVLAFATIIGLLFTSYRYIGDLMGGMTGMFGQRLVEELTGAYSAALLFPAVLWVARRFRVDRAHWMARLPIQLVAAVVYAALHTALMVVSRDMLFPLAGLGAYHHGPLGLRFLMELSNDLLWYTLIVSFIYLFDHYRAARDHELRAAQLESRLAQAQLQNLRLQLQPHFLFNALNTIASVMYEDMRAADAMLEKLSELLRHTLHAEPAQETTLEEELRVLGLYLDIMRARFEERLDVRIRVAPGAERAMVPQLILQPLVENAIRHGIDAGSGRGRIDITCAREDGSLLLEVRDHGSGLQVPVEVALRSGIGLSNTADRLAQLYGAGHRLALANAEDGGLRVTVSIPYRATSDSALAEAATA